MDIEDLNIEQARFVNNACANTRRLLRRIIQRLELKSTPARSLLLRSLRNAEVALGATCELTHKRLQRLRAAELPPKPSAGRQARFEVQEQKHEQRERGL